MTVLMCMCIVYLLTITESNTQKEKTKEQMRGKSKINVLLFLGPNWNLQGKKKIGGLSIDNSNSNENFKKAIGLIIMKQNNGFACAWCFLYNSFCRNMPTKWNGPMKRFVEDVNARQQLPFTFSELRYSSCRIHIPKICQNLMSWTRWNTL